MRLLHHHVLARPASANGKAKDSGGEAGTGAIKRTVDESKNNLQTNVAEQLSAAGAIDGDNATTTTLDEDTLKAMLRSQFDEALSKMDLQLSPSATKSTKRPSTGQQAPPQQGGRGESDPLRPSSQPLQAPSTFSPHSASPQAISRPSTKINAFGANLLNKNIAVKFADGKVSGR